MLFDGNHRDVVDSENIIIVKTNARAFPLKNSNKVNMMRFSNILYNSAFA
jgi:hypothetical protein